MKGDASLGVKRHAILGRGKSSDCSQKSRSAGHIVQGHGRVQTLPAGQLSLEDFAVRFAEQLDFAERIVPVVGAKVEVVECERLLEYRRIGGDDICRMKP